MRWWTKFNSCMNPYVIYHLQNLTELDMQYKNNGDHCICNVSSGASYWLPLCGIGLLGWGWWISSHLSWTHFHHQDSISICGRSYQPQCICNVSLSSDSVHWESLFSAAAGSNGSYFPGKYLYNCVNCRMYAGPHFPTILFSCSLSSDICFHFSVHCNGNFMHRHLILQCPEGSSSPLHFPPRAQAAFLLSVFFIFPAWSAYGSTHTIAAIGSSSQLSYLRNIPIISGAAAILELLDTEYEGSVLLQTIGNCFPNNTA